MRKNLKLLGLVAALLLTSGCASENVLRRGDKLGGYELVTAYSGKINDKPYWDVDFKDNNYHHYPAKMNNDGTGEITLGKTNYFFQFVESKTPEKRGVILKSYNPVK
jgi:hypothetical protein